MRYYPVFFDIHGKRCLVVGGGTVGTRKVLTLLKCGADVTVVSPCFDDRLLGLAETGAVSLKSRCYRSSDLEGVFMVFGATDNEELNRRVHEDAEKCNVLCNIVDRPEACSFVLPSVVERGDLLIAISTSGKSPALARKLRTELEKQFGQEYDDLLILMGAVRKKLLARHHNSCEHQKIFRQLIESDLIERIRDHDVDRINERLREILGEGYAFADLMRMNS
ncbi:MAG: bifunctional precorrin-2 dehydrogenase/sirohydrochlorin ferrochelatase [Desulfobacterales bacterium]|nr:bifunctional precorrin-2 dehydrogenase/sirohydrochlorin ferrochelatase [Desulfobacterales bacterium]MDD4072376.1 bifunctional precorrin-2 dehydrogenase/sirohydrochlorin ferrochelatase [Desulfobacterales bacterium]MDD4392337.1 bifunctional precorrin-2 dehydrogenase/sirohydrochlorin ferrochelatase [Desulfobacterales bacterium]